MYHAIFFFCQCHWLYSQKVPLLQMKTELSGVIVDMKSNFLPCFFSMFQRVFYCTFSSVFSLENKSGYFKLSSHLKSLYLFFLLDSLHASYMKWDAQSDTTFWQSLYLCSVEWKDFILCYVQHPCLYSKYDMSSPNKTFSNFDLGSVCDFQCNCCSESLSAQFKSLLICVYKQHFIHLNVNTV